MPLDVPGCTRATMIIAVSISFTLFIHRMRESVYSILIVFSFLAKAVVVLNVYLCAR